MRRVLLALSWIASAGAAELLNPGSVIQTAPLDDTRPYFIATHPRVTTTVRFPRAIDPPEGAVGVFTEDGRTSAAEYLISWQPGDAFFTLVPGREAKLANLNVPFEGRTFVIYFYPAPDPLKAVAALNLSAGTQASAGPVALEPAGGHAAKVQRTTQPPARRAPAPTAQLLLGFMDRMKVVHATAEGPSLAALAKAMGLDVVVCAPVTPGNPSRIPAPVMDSGWYQLVLLRVVRDPRQHAIGFIGLLRNVSRETLVFDPASFGVRAGAAYYPQCISDAPGVLPPGSQSPIYFVIQPGPAAPLAVGNDWRISVDLLSPTMNPGAALLREFTRQSHP